MKAMVLENARMLALRDIAEPAIGALDVLVRVKACGVCGSDVHGYDGSTGRRIPPLIMGHEAAGIVARIGTEVRSVHVGDRVTFDSTVSCGSCFFCRMGAVNLCENRKVLGVSCADYRCNGAFAEYVAVPQHIVYKLPDSLSFEKAALIEAVSIAVHAAKITGIGPGSSAAVIGVGMIGLLAVQAFRIYGCSKIIAVDLDEGKLQLARQMAADHILRGDDPDLIAKIQALTEGRGPEIAVEAVGAQKTIQTAINVVRKGGTVTLIGNLSPTVELPLQTVVTRQLRLLGSCASAGEYRECIDLMASGSIDVEPLISAVAPLSEGPDWFNRLYAREPGLMKVILQP
jgi:L-iditol 2-dehydrogenase